MNNALRRAALACATAIVLPFCTAPVSAYTTIGGEMSMEDLVRNSTAVVQGTVVDKSTAVLPGARFETQYRIKVSEQLKGKTKLNTGEPLLLTVPGGELTTPPLTQLVIGTPQMYRSEEVVLFLQPPPPATESRRKKLTSKSGLINSMVVTGWREGKFSVLTDKNTGEKFVTRLNLEEYGYAPNDKTAKQLHEAIGNGSLPVARKQIVAQKRVAKSSKPVPVDQSKLDTSEVKSLVKFQTRAPILQDLNSFKAQIQTSPENN